MGSIDEQMAKGPKEGDGGAAAVDAHTLLCNLRFSYINAIALKCALELKIPNTVAAGEPGRPVSLSDLTEALSIPPSKSNHLRRIMRLLVNSGVFSAAHAAAGEHEARTDVGELEPAYLPTTLSSFLTDGSSLGLSQFALLGMEPFLVAPFNHLSKWFRCQDEKKSSAFELVNGENPWRFAGRNPEFNKLFNAAMAEDSRFLLPVLIEALPEVFTGVGSLVDVGGGDGSTAKAIAMAFPAVKCTVLDLPHVVAAATGDGGVEFVAGDMFQHVPPADAVLLKWILHEWGDEESVKILRRCKDAVSGSAAGGKIIVIDMVVGGGRGIGPKEIETQLFWDVRMMVAFAEAERDEREWKSIFAAAGLSNFKILPAALGFCSVIETYP